MSTKVRDVMTSPVEAVGPSAGFKAIVERLRTHGISAVPVIDGTGRVLGVVSEADLLLKEDRVDIESHHPLVETVRARRVRAKAAASTAAQLMTSPAATIPPDATVAEAARTMRRRGVRRLLIVDEQDHAIGIVSRGDLLAVFSRSDEEIRREIVDDVIGHTLLLDPAPYAVTVEDGLVTLAGQADRRTDAILVRRLSERIDGVVGVHDELTFRQDDGHLPPPRPARAPFHPIRF
jgi:CBS domain-containing protein